MNELLLLEDVILRTNLLIKTVRNFRSLLKPEYKCLRTVSNNMIAELGVYSRFFENLKKELKKNEESGIFCTDSDDDFYDGE